MRMFWLGGFCSDVEDWRWLSGAVAGEADGLVRKNAG